MNPLAIWMGAGLMMTASAGEAAPPCELEGVPVPGFTTSHISAAQFKALHQKVAPHGQGEGWATIPWQTDLRAARRLALREGKPLMMWVMDGHPLGCT
jgi:hypothetical protein